MMAILSLIRNLYSKSMVYQKIINLFHYFSLFPKVKADDSFESDKLFKCSKVI